MVNLDKIDKEKYFQRANLLLQENGLGCFLLDKERFSVQISARKAKIHLIPFSSKTVTKEELSKAKLLDCFIIINDRYTKRKKGECGALRENAYILLDLDEEDK